MNASRADSRLTRVSRLCALVAAVLTPCTALAQSEGPIRLTPPTGNPFQSPQGSGSRDDGAPPRPLGSPPAVERIPLSPPGGTEPEIQVRPLTAPPERAAGGLPEGAGLGAEVWSNADPSEIERLLRDLPLPPAERSLSALLQRLMLTRAAVGGGADLAALRAQTLVRLGNVDGARALVSSIEGSISGAAPVQAEIEASLVEGDTGEACRAAGGATQAEFDLFVQRALVFCQIVAGENDRASIGLDVLRESAATSDPLFIALAEKLLGFGSLPQRSEGGLSLLGLAMWQQTGEPVPREAWLPSDPAVWRAIATSATAPLEDRIEAAELAVAYGALGGEALAGLYRQLKGGPGERDRIGSEDPPAWSVRERALLFQNADAAETQPELAAALQRLMDLARARGGYEAAVIAALPLLGELDPTARLTFFAPHAARAHLLVHDVTSAEQWADLARREREVNPYAARDAIDLEPLFALTGGSENPRLTDDAFAAWWQQRLEEEPTVAPEKAALIVDLLEALGEPVPASAGILARQGRLVGDSGGTSGTSRPGLAEAVADKARGRTILEAVHLLGAGGSAERGAGAVAEAVRALRLVGLADEARRLAIEAAVDAGI